MIHTFTKANVDYCQDFLNNMSNVDFFRFKIFHYDGSKRYGHSTTNSGS